MKISILLTTLIFCTITFAEDKINLITRTNSELIEIANVHFSYPKTIHYKLAKDPDDGFKPSLSFAKFENQSKILGLKIIPITPMMEGLNTKEEFTIILNKVCGKYIARSVEGRINEKELKTKNCYGFHTTFTDKSIDPKATLKFGQYRQITIGVYKINNYLFFTKLYTNEEKDFNEAIEIIKTVNLTKK